MPKVGLRMSAGAATASVTTRLYDCAVVGVACTDHGVSANVCVDQNAPFGSALPGAVNAVTVPTDGVMVIAFPGTNPYPNTPIVFWAGAGLVVETVNPDPGL